ncbi:MAG: stage III sporulation protein AD [Anaerovoracaceae bacterium]|nr:stage III sporulation protein AD [Bacillota bacterium]MDY5906080.1 stage III sporulation protein AD [Anaerovoracaceae bacterium]
MFQIAAIGLAGTLLSLAVRSYRPEFSVYISIASGIILFMTVIAQFSDILSVVSDVFSRSGYANSYFPVLLKILAIAYLTDLISQVCRDAGENGIASKTEMAGKIFILYASLPVFTSILSMIDILLRNAGA